MQAQPIEIAIAHADIHPLKQGVRAFPFALESLQFFRFTHCKSLPNVNKCGNYGIFRS